MRLNLYSLGILPMLIEKKGHCILDFKKSGQFEVNSNYLECNARKPTQLKTNNAYIRVVGAKE